MKKTRYFILCAIVFLCSNFFISCQQDSQEPFEPDVSQAPIINVSPTPGDSLVEDTTDNPTMNGQVLGEQEILIQANYVIGEFRTNFSRSSQSRKKNIRNAASKVHLVVVYPQEEFSISSYLVPFTEENGYYPAGAYVNGKVVNSLGGGVCQVSTTLYNAVLEAQLTILERHPHSMTVSYVEIGRDAAIAENLKDFRFLNSLDVPIVIEAVVTGGDELIFRIRTIKQTRPDDQVISFETKILEEINPADPVIEYDATKPENYILVTQSAHPGYKAELYRITTVNGVEVERIKINYSEYEASPQHMIIGKK